MYPIKWEFEYDDSGKEEEHQHHSRGSNFGSKKYGRLQTLQFARHPKDFELEPIVHMYSKDA